MLSKRFAGLVGGAALALAVWALWPHAEAGGGGKG